MCAFSSYRKLGQTENHFYVDRRIRAHSCKSISSFIFTSNHLHSSHNTPNSSQITHSSHSPTVLSMFSHTHSSPIVHPSTSESHPSTGEIAPWTHSPINLPRPPARSRHEPTNRLTHPVSDPLLDRPTTFKSTHLVHRRVAPTNQSLSIPLSRLVLWFWFFLFWFLFLVLFIYFDSL